MPHVWWCWALPFMRCHDKPLSTMVPKKHDWWISMIGAGDLSMFDKRSNWRKKHYTVRICSNDYSLEERMCLWTWLLQQENLLPLCNHQHCHSARCPNHLANNYPNSSSKVSRTWSLLALIPALDIPKPWSQGNWATLKDLACRLHFTLNFYQG